MNQIATRIIHIITGLATGGAEHALYNLLYGGLTKHFSNHVISLMDEGTFGSRIHELGVPVTTLNMRRGIPSLSGMLELRRLIRESKPNIIQGWMYHGNLVATLAKTFALGKPNLTWNIRHSLYSLDQEKILSRQVIRANRFLSSFPDVLFYNSHLSREQHEHFGFSSKNGRIIPNGIDTFRFSYSLVSRQRVRSELGIPDNSLIIGHVARLHSMKDHSLFLRVAAKIAALYPEVHFVLAGQGVLLTNKMLAQLIPERIGNRFHMLGNRSDVPDLMNGMDVFCLSSRGEAFPNVIGEAMATGIPCVATDVGDSAIIIGDTGVIVPPHNEHELTAGLERILAMSTKERSELGAKARTRIDTNYTLSATVNQYIMKYEQLVGAEDMGCSCTES